MNMTARIHGDEAIAYAEEHGETLCKYGDPIEGWRSDVSVTEAREIAAIDPALVYVELPEPPQSR